MKLWQKIFIVSLSLFLIVFDLGVFFLTQISFQNSLNSEKERTFAEFNIISKAITKDMVAINARTSDSSLALESLIYSYTSYYKSQKVYLELLINDQPLFTSIPIENGTRMTIDVTEGSINSTIQTIKSTKFLVVGGKLLKPLNYYKLVLARDLSTLMSSQAQLTTVLISVSVLISVLFAFVLFLIMKGFLSPIRKLSEATKRIAEGRYENRAVVKGKDEISELAVSFNNMAGQVQNQMKELETMALGKQQFIDNFAHELRTPLTSIYGYAEYIQKANISDEDKFIATNYIMSESQRLQNISNKLLNLALVKHDKLQVEKIDIAHLFESSIATVMKKALEKQIVIDKRVDVAIVFGDEELLLCLLINLLDNAIKASEVGSLVEISSYIDEGIVLAVRDSGIGISEAELDSIAKPFYRSDKSRSRQEGGAGLGLALCMEIAELHSAKLEFSSVLGQGTIVRLKFTS